MKKLLAITAMLACHCTTLLAQDKMVNALPIDNKLRTIDSLSLARLRHREQATYADATMLDLYPSWTNEYVRYSAAQMPSEYKIDLTGFHMPCDSRLVTSQYGYRAKFRRMHYGTDIKVYVGDTIRAAFDGKVRVVAYEGKGYGKYVIIRHPNGLETLYGHMSKQLVRENEDIKAGEPVGLGGNTGRSTGPHLHFETRFLGEFINPELLFSFEARDVKADTYIYKGHGKGTLVNNHNIVGGEQAMSQQEAQAQTQQRQQQRQQRVTYKVKKGDTLYSIAKKYGTTVDKLCRLNNWSKNKVLKPGQIIRCS